MADKWIISDIADSIKKKIFGGIVYGTPVNENSSIDTIIVAAYIFGLSDRDKNFIYLKHSPLQIVPKPNQNITQTTTATS